jgi:hypothetical protein
VPVGFKAINGAGNGRVSGEGETAAVNGSGPVAVRCRGVSVSGQQGRAGPGRVREVGLSRSGSRAWSPGMAGARRTDGSRLGVGCTAGAALLGGLFGSLAG